MILARRLDQRAEAKYLVDADCPMTAPRLEQHIAAELASDLSGATPEYVVWLRRIAVRLGITVTSDTDTLSDAA